MANSLFDLLVRLALACAIAAILALLVRRPLRSLFGAAAAYQAWLLVPVAMAAAALPPLQIRQEVVAVLVPALKLASFTAPATAPGSIDWPGWLLAAWLAGAAIMLLILVRGQRRYVARLGRLEERDGIWFAPTLHDGPALLGLWRPKIVVPADFASRYDPCEQALIIAHEQCHGARLDPLANAAAALLQCAFWFNPLMHYAASRYRFDQELACDAKVLTRHPGRARTYAAAMLKTQTSGAPALATCHWQSSHPLKERILQLNKPIPSILRRAGGRLLVASLLCTSAMAAVVAQAETLKAAAATYLVAITLESGGHTSSPKIHAREGESFKVTFARSDPGQKASSFTGDFTVNHAGEDKIGLDMKATVNGQVLGEPRLKMTIGEPTGLWVSGDDRVRYNMTITVTPLQKVPETAVSSHVE